MVLEVHPSSPEGSFLDLMAGVAVEMADAPTLKLWARFAAQSSTLDLMGVTSTVYSALWWQVMAVNAWASASAYARGGQWQWMINWLSHQYEEVCGAARCWEEVIERLQVLASSRMRVDAFLHAATQQQQAMAALAQQLPPVALALCTSLGLALPQPFVPVFEQPPTASPVGGEV